MFKERIRLWRLERRVGRGYRFQLEKAKSEDDRSRIGKIHDQYRWELLEIEELWQSLNQQKLVRKARRFSLPVPTRDTSTIIMEGWEDDNWKLGRFGEMLLKDHAVENLRRVIRKEQKEKIDLILIPRISLSIGLLGAAAACFALWVVWYSR